MNPTRDELEAAIADLARLKAEHAPILKQIAGDANMAAETRQMLIEHLYEEEDEHVQAMQGLRDRPPLSGGAAGAPSPSPSLSVGSLRPAQPRTTSLGELRAPLPPLGSAGGLPPGTTVGTLRPY